LKKRLLRGLSVVWLGLQVVQALADGAVPVPVQGGQMARQCSTAYRQEDLFFLLKNCPEEAWALARAQCEQEPGKVKPRFAEFCKLFYTGKAPSYGR
jgi:hypothetical protein